jgi:hypothetical protein
MDLSVQVHLDIYMWGGFGRIVRTTQFVRPAAMEE